MYANVLKCFFRKLINWEQKNNFNCILLFATLSHDIFLSLFSVIGNKIASSMWIVIVNTAKKNNSCHVTPPYAADTSKEQTFSPSLKPGCNKIATQNLGSSVPVRIVLI